MKKQPIYLISHVLLVLILSSCKRDCSQIYATLPLAPVIIELRDAQDRDLLDLATPAHFDTAEIKKINENLRVRVIPANNAATTGNKDRIRLWLNISNYYSSLKLHLSSTITDDVAAGFSIEPHECNVLYKLSTFTYNGITYPETYTQYYIIKK